MIAREVIRVAHHDERSLAWQLIGYWSREIFKTEFGIPLNVICQDNFDVVDGELIIVTKKSMCAAVDDAVALGVAEIIGDRRDLEHARLWFAIWGPPPCCYPSHEVTD